MLKTIIISPDTELGQYVNNALTDVGGASVVRIVNNYLGQIELARILRSHGPQVLFISIEQPDQAISIATQVEQVMPGIQVVAIARHCEPETLVEIMRAGIRDYLTAPFDRACLQRCLARLNEALLKRPVASQATEYLYSFLPSKPGVGATTLAINASMALAQNREVNSLLMDFDLNCGMVRFMLKLNTSYSVLDAAEHAANMDEDLWPQIVTRYHRLDVVHAGLLNPEIRIQTMQINHLLDYARRNYKVVSVDLSGNLEKYSMEIMHESRKVFLVCTPEVASLHLAREKLQYLTHMGLGGRVHVLLNRYIKRSSVSPAEVAQILGVPVTMTFPNDYSRVNRAINEGKAVDASSELGRCCNALSEHMLERRPMVTAETKRRFVEYFNISPARFSLERNR